MQYPKVHFLVDGTTFRHYLNFVFIQTTFTHIYERTGFGWKVYGENTINLVQDSTDILQYTGQSHSYKK